MPCQLGGPRVELRGLLGEVALGFGPILGGAALLCLDDRPGIAQSVARRGRGRVKLGTEFAKPLELGRDSVALIRQMRLFVAKQSVRIRMAVLDPADESRREPAGAIAEPFGLATGFLRLLQQSDRVSPRAGELFAFRAKRRAGIRKRLLAFHVAQIALVGVRRHDPRLLPRRNNPQSLSAEERGGVEEELRQSQDR